MSDSPSNQFHLAQANIARMRGNLDSSIMSGLVARIEEMNALAESSDGFVWRIPGADVKADSLLVFQDHHSPFEVERIFYNMSVWESVKSLQNYVYNSVHAEMLRAKHDWIEDSDEPSLILWWIPAGTRPTVDESAERWQMLRRYGPTVAAFTLSELFASPSE